MIKLDNWYLVNNNLIRKIFLFIAISIFCFGCEEKNAINPDCDNCYTPKPEWGYLKVKLTINNENQHIPVTIYKGIIDDSIAIYKEVISEEEHYFEVPVNNFYSVLAIYKSGDKTIHAIDGASIETSEYDKCDESCWVILGGYLDVSLTDYFY